MVQYVFVEWENGVKDSTRILDLKGKTVIIGYYEKMNMANKILRGTAINVTENIPLAGEQIIVTVTNPDGSNPQTLTATVEADGSFNVTFNGSAGAKYLAKSSILETETHLPGESDPLSFSLPKNTVKITLTTN